MKTSNRGHPGETKTKTQKSKNRVKKFGETLREKTEARIFANFDNFATFVDRAVFTGARGFQIWYLALNIRKL